MFGEKTPKQRNPIRDLSVEVSKEPRPGLPTDFQPTTRRRQYADAAMAAAQHVYELEEALHAAQADRDEFKATSVISQRENVELIRKLEAMERDRNKYRDYVISIEARFDAAAKIMLGVLDDRLPRNGERSIAEALPSERTETLEEEIARLATEQRGPGAKVPS